MHTVNHHIHVLKKDLRNVYSSYVYPVGCNLFSCPSVDLPVGTMGVSELFFLKQPSWFCNISSLTVNQFI